MGRGTPSSRDPQPEGPGYWTALKDVSLAAFEARARPLRFPATDIQRRLLARPGPDAAAPPAPAASLHVTGARHGR